MLRGAYPDESSTRNYLTANIKEVLNYCENRPKFVVDKALWLKRFLKA